MAHSQHAWLSLGSATKLAKCMPKYFRALECSALDRLDAGPERHKHASSIMCLLEHVSNKQSYSSAELE